MSGCGQSHERPENDSKKLWLKLPVLAPSRVKIQTKEGIHSLKRLVVNGLYIVVIGLLNYYTVKI